MRFVIATFACLSLACCFALAAEPAWDVAGSAPKGKTKSLFDGKTLDGWTQIPPSTWEVKDGAMASTGGPRGVIYTNDDFKNYRLMFTMRHVKGEKDHQACALIFCTRPEEGQKPADALAGIQFQVPLGGSWDYRKGHNNDGLKIKKEGDKIVFTRVMKPDFNVHEWSRVELLVNGDKGEAKMAVAQPVGSKAVEVLQFKDETAGKKGPIGWQIHNATLFDEYKDVEIEVDPTSDELITTK